MDAHQYGYTNTAANRSHAYLLPEVIRRLHAAMGSQSATVLEIGCGNGYVASKLGELGHRVTGFDGSADGIELARSAYPNVEFRVASVYERDLLAEIGSKADCVVSL